MTIDIQTLQATYRKHAAHTSALVSVPLAISPALARSMLERNLVNRSIRKHVVARYAADMARGSWDADNPHGIVFNHDLELVDGQHRLTAIACVERTIPLVVTFNSTARYNTPMDRNEVRTIADVTMKSPRTVSTASALIALLYGHGRIVTASEVEAVLADYGAHIEWALSALSMRRPGSSGIAAGFAFAHSVDPTLAKSFATKFKNMEGGATSPIRLLHEFKDKPGQDTQAARQQAAWITLRCLECFAKKQPMQRLVRPDLGYAYFLRRSQREKN